MITSVYLWLVIQSSIIYMDIIDVGRGGENQVNRVSSSSIG